VTSAVVSLSRAHHVFAALLLPDVACEVITAIDRVYLLYFTRPGGTDSRFVDPMDGEPLLELNFFASEVEARAWIKRDIALRSPEMEGVQ
jgi:hypothetical protein